MAKLRMTRREQLIILVQTMVLSDKKISSANAVTAVSLALRADEDIPGDLLQAARQIVEYAISGNSDSWPSWVREDFEGT